MAEQTTTVAADALASAVSSDDGNAMQVDELTSSSAPASGSSPELGATTEEAAEPVTGDSFILGIDFGSEESVLTITKKRDSVLPFLVHNPTSHVANSSAFAIRDGQRLLGDDALAQTSLNPQQAVILSKRFVGRHGAEAEAEAAAMVHCRLEQALASNGPRLAAVLPSLEAPMPVFLELIVAALLKHYASFAYRDMLYWQSTTPVQAASCVLTVPIAFEEASRAALADAAVIAGLVPLAIIDDTTAAAIYYGVCRDSSLFPASPDSSAEKAAASPDGAATPAKHVLFVDMGSQYLNVSLVEYRKSALRVVATAHDTVGGWHLTNEIASHVASVLKSKRHVDVESHARSKARLFAGAEKVKKVLSTVADAVLEVDNLLDMDVREPLKRSAIEKLWEPILERVQGTVARVFETAAIAPADCCDLKVEIIGGSVRVPAVQERIKAAVGVTDLSRTLDGSTSIATGAAIYGNLLTTGCGALQAGATYQVLDDRLSKPLAPIGSSSRLSESEIASAIEFENQLAEQARKIAALQHLKNEFEQLIYLQRERLRDVSSEQVPEHEKDAALALLGREEEWLLYSEEAEAASYDDVRARLDSMSAALSACAPAFAAHVKRIEDEKAAAAAAAALAEQSRQETFRDKLARPITTKEKFEAAHKRKEQGTKCFKELDYDLAAVRYTQAINILKEVQGEPSNEQQAEMDGILSACWMNLAMCFIKLEKYQLAIENCNLVLRAEPRNVKALFRRAAAYEANKQLDEARTDLVLAAEIEPDNKAVRNQLKIVDHKIQTRAEKEKQIYAKMFS